MRIKLPYYGNKLITYYVINRRYLDAMVPVFDGAWREQKTSLIAEQYHTKTRVYIFGIFEGQVVMELRSGKLRRNY